MCDRAAYIHSGLWYENAGFYNLPRENYFFFLILDRQSFLNERLDMELQKKNSYKSLRLLIGKLELVVT